MTTKVRVWDLPTRLFHWSLVICVAFMWWSAEQGGDWMQYHLWCGVVLVTLLLFRLTWGIVGSQTSRFSDFLHGPRHIIRYLQGDLTENQQPGHNPLGGWMVLILLLTLICQVTTGLLSADVNSYLYDGFLAKYIDSDLAEQFTGWHKLSFKFLLALISLHLLAIIAYHIFRKQRLVRAMITGRKELEGEVPKLQFTSTITATGILLALAIIVYFVLLH